MSRRTVIGAGQITMPDDAHDALGLGSRRVARVEPVDGVALRAMRLDDLETVRGWILAPHVAEFWGEGVDAELADMRAELEAGGPTTYRVVTLDGRDVGMVFWYPIHAYPEYVHELADAGVDVAEGAWSIDYLIGDAGATGRGVGSGMLRAACAEVWSGQPGASELVVPVHADNHRSWRALERAGFTRLAGTFDMAPDNPAHDRRHVVSRIARPC